MELIQGLDSLPPLGLPTAVAIGNFDGVHLGHQAILRLLVTEAQRQNLPSYVLTFFPHPENILGPRRIPLIQTKEQRLKDIAKYGVTALVLVPFDLQFASLTGREFVENILLERLRAHMVIIGENFRFGRDRTGDIAALKALAGSRDFTIRSVPPVRHRGRVVSSSLIRRLLQEGHIEPALDFLGHAYEIEGTVVKGRSRGKGLGFPTANIHPENDILPRGVFLTLALVGEEAFPSLTNIGQRPTFGDRRRVIESYVIGFDGNLYGKRLRIQFCRKLREERKFRSEAELAVQIEKDLDAAKAFFRLK